MSDEHAAETVRDMRREVVEENRCQIHPGAPYAEQWDVVALSEAVKAQLNPIFRSRNGRQRRASPRRKSAIAVDKASDELMARRRKFGPELMRAVEKQVLLQTLGHLWRRAPPRRSTISAPSSAFRGYAQRDPLNEYKTEGSALPDAARQSPARRHGAARACRNQQRRAEPPPTLVAEAHHTDARDRRGPRAPAQIPASLRPQPQARAEARRQKSHDMGEVGRNDALPFAGPARSTRGHGMVIA